MITHADAKNQSPKKATQKNELVLGEKFTRVENHLIEAWIKVSLSGLDLRTLLFILRKTNGYGKIWDKISNSQFSEALGIKRRGVWRLIQKLHHMGLIGITQNGDRQMNSYCIQKDLLKWRLSSKMVIGQKIDKIDYPITQNGYTLSPKNDHPITLEDDRSITQKDDYKRKKEISKEIKEKDFDFSSLFNSHLKELKPEITNEEFEAKRTLLLKQGEHLKRQAVKEVS